MKKKILYIVLGIVFILFVLGLVTSYIDSARVRNTVEPKYTIKIVSKTGDKVTYWGLGYKIIRYPSVSPNEPYKNNRGVKYGNWFMKYELSLDEEKVTVKELNEVNDKIIEYFSLDDKVEYNNYGYNYIDYENMVVVVGLKENTKEEQNKFREMVVDSDLIKFEEGKIVVSDKTTVEEIKLKTEIEVTNHGNSDSDLVKYKVYIKDSKLYAVNLKNNEEKIVFDKEYVKNIAIRSICCAGNGYLLILTDDGNVYMSAKDCNYNFSFDFPFKKLDVSNIEKFKLVPAFDYDMARNLYGVDKNGNEILLHKMN